MINSVKEVREQIAKEREEAKQEQIKVFADMTNRLIRFMVEGETTGRSWHNIHYTDGQIIIYKKGEGSVETIEQLIKDTDLVISEKKDKYIITLK